MRYSGCRLSTTAHSFGTAVGHPIWVWSKPQRTPQKSYFDRVYEPYLGVKEEWVLEKQSIAGISPRKRAVACHASDAALIATGISIELILAQIVGWLVIVGSTVRSVPQILRILRNKSVDGLSPSSFVSELSAYIITVAYNMKFGYEISTWGETFTSAVQHGILVALIFHFNKETSKQAKILTVALLVFGTTFLLSSLCTETILRTLQSLVAIILAVGGRMPQIWLNMKRGNSGELSFISTLLSVLGNIARVFTTWVLVKDPIIMATAVSQLSLNSILLFQIVQTMKGNAPYRQQMAA